MDVLIQGNPAELRVCSREEANHWAERPIFLGNFSNQDWYAAQANQDAGALLPASFSPVRSLLAELPEDMLQIVGRAIACVEFEDTHRFCGRCGEATTPLASDATPSAGERAVQCPRCTLTFHPRIPPAVIVLVERGEEILLARGAKFPVGRFSAVAGFVEIGESLEEAARREVKEEVGVDVTNLRYFASQPWPFGRSLMVAFRADFAGGELHPDGTEIVEAGWFQRDRLPLLPPPISVARKLIDGFLARFPRPLE